MAASLLMLELESELTSITASETDDVVDSSTTGVSVTEAVELQPANSNTVPAARTLAKFFFCMEKRGKEKMRKSVCPFSDEEASKD